MVVRENDRGGIDRQRFLDHFARVDERVVDGSALLYFVGDQAVFLVQIQDTEDFVILVCHGGAAVIHQPVPGIQHRAVADLAAQQLQRRRFADFDGGDRTFAEAGRSVQVSTEGAHQARWAPVGRTLYYASTDKMFSVDLERAGAATHPQPELLFEAPHRISDFTVAPDGRFLVVLRDDSIVEPVHVIVNWTPPEE